MATEVENIKRYATPEEIAKLNLASIDSYDKTGCIYGQMTGSCLSFRATEMIEKCCVRYINQLPTYDGYTERFNKVFSEHINGREMPDGFVAREDVHDVWDNDRTTNYLSALEGWIIRPEANLKGIVRYIKGDTDKLVLETKNKRK